MSWQQPSRQALCNLLNGLFAREPAIASLLSAHAGQTFRLVADPIDSAMTISHDGKFSAADLAVVPDVTLTIDTRALWASGWRPGQPLPERAGLVQVSGDVALAQTLSMLAKSWRFDPQDLLSSVFGDVAAVQMVAGAKQLTTLASRFVTRTTENLTEYVTYEAQLLANPASTRELQENLSGLQKRLAESAERLQALTRRVNQYDNVESEGKR